MFDDGQAKASSRQKDSDSYLYPAGEILKPRKVKKTRASINYAVTKKVCDACVIRSECTKSKIGRTIKRHFRQGDTLRIQKSKVARIVAGTDPGVRNIGHTKY